MKKLEKGETVASVKLHKKEVPKAINEYPTTFSQIFTYLYIEILFYHFHFFLFYFFLDLLLFLSEIRINLQERKAGAPVQTFSRDDATGIQT